MIMATWYVVAVAATNPGDSFAPETETFLKRDDAFAWLERCQNKGYQWGKCYAARNDGRYIFEREFQQRN